MVSWRAMNHFARVTVVYNPTKSFRKVQSFISQAKSQNDHLQIEVLRTESFEDIEHKAHQAISTGCDLCIAAGGDGTVLGVLNAAIKADTFFSILPLGTSNDFAMSLGINNVEDAVDVLFHGRVRNVDAGVCGYLADDGSEREMYFGSTAGVGVLARVFTYERSRIATLLKSILGNGVYPLFTTVSMFSGGTSSTELILNDTRITTRMKLFEVSKVRVVGGTVFTPYAEVDNGIFDAWMLHDTNPFKALNVFITAGKPGARHLSSSGFSYFSGDEALNRYRCGKLTQITVTPEKALPVHLNGDRVGLTPCRLRILPGELKVLC